MFAQRAIRSKHARIPSPPPHRWVRKNLLQSLVELGAPIKAVSAWHSILKTKTSKAAPDKQREIITCHHTISCGISNKYVRSGESASHHMHAHCARTYMCLASNTTREWHFTGCAVYPCQVKASAKARTSGITQARNTQRNGGNSACVSSFALS